MATVIDIKDQQRSQWRDAAGAWEHYFDWYSAAFGPLMAAELRSLVGEAKGFPLAALEPFRADGLHTAMYVVPILAAILAVVLFAASRTVKNDVHRLQTWMREGVQVKS